MPRTETPAPGHAHRRLLLVTVALVVALAGPYAVRGDWETAAGVVTGAGVVLALVMLAGRRAASRRTEAATATRVLGFRADERDSRVLVGTLAVVGLAGLVVGALGPVAVRLGTSAEGLLGSLSWVLVLTGVVAFVVIDRRT